MKIVLATLNSKYIHSCLSLWCLKAGVEAFCTKKHNIDVVESTVNADINEFIENITAVSPDVVAFSCYIWNTEKILSVCNVLKSAIDCKIILGGPEVQYRQGDILNNYPCVDYVLSGEGEWTFSSFIEALTAEKSFDNCEGLSFRKSGKIISVPCKTYKETPPSPYCDEYFQKLNGRITYIESSRGCPFRCAYCLSGGMSGLRYFDFEQVCTDIIRLSESGTKTVKFIDRTFNADSKKANRILNFIKTNYGTRIKQDVCFHFEIAADILTDDTFDILSTMPCGLIQLEIGIQSFNNKTLEAINRKSDLTKVFNNISKLISLKNMHIHIDLIAGLPYEGFESFKNSFNTAYSLKADMLQLGFLKLLYGADMRENSQRYPCTFSPNPPYEITETPWLKPDDIKRLKGCEEALDRLYNSGRFLITLDYLVNDKGFDAFELFCDFGGSYNFSKIGLTEFIGLLYSHLKDKCDENLLRESILCDIASLPVNIHIPTELTVYDKNYKKIMKQYTELLHKNVRIVILYSKRKVFVVHTDKQDKINGRFFSEYYDL